MDGYSRLVPIPRAPVPAAQWPKVGYGLEEII
jgi:hypothetical protein